ncbi:hypothetical protein CTheo_4017 [Ceratobasidium theobromae]|uniref:Transmembrane protein n=1 Tax=Ceratobasidium theobromae TaxID=1582974 RepID=A0A5N5QLC3_9AGAM|nr:hypothetical protein CTheo_4017 [Ceratobasidium theobromae]
MATGAYGLTPKAMFGLSAMQCTTQGMIISLLVTFLTSPPTPGRSPWFKAYVISVNVLGLVQTIIVILQGVDIFGPRPAREILVVIFHLLTTLIGTFVQAFFLHRCWRIFNKRFWPTAPFLVLLASAFASGTASVIYAAQGTNSAKKASAAPPLVLATIIIVNRSIGLGEPAGFTVLAATMTAKVFELSLMISLVGQGYVRKQFQQFYSPSTPNINVSQGAGITSEPVFAHATTNIHELEPGTEFAGSQTADFRSSQESSSPFKGSEKKLSNTSSLELTGVEIGEAAPTVIHQVRFLNSPTG